MDKPHERYSEHQSFRTGNGQVPPKPNFTNQVNKEFKSVNNANEDKGAVTAYKQDNEKLKLVAYASKAAFQVESSITKDGHKTVTLESAHKNDPNNPNIKSFNWSKKCKFQITLEEIPLFIAVLLGLTSAVRFDNHGDDNKYLEITNQGGKFFFKMGGRTGLYVAPVPVVLAYQFGTLGLNEYVKNFPSLNSETALLSIRLMIKQMSENGLIKLPTGNQ